MRKRLVFIAAFLFLLLFRPTILPIDLIYILTIFSTCMLLWEAKRRKLDGRAWIAQLPSNIYVRIALVLTGIVLFAVIYNAVAYGAAIENFIMAAARMIMTFVVFPVNLLWLFVYCKTRRITTDELLKSLFYAIVLQLLCVVAAYLFPPVKDLFISLMQINGNWTDRWTMNNTAEYRMFGFAKTLFDTYGFGMGILSIVPLVLAYRLKQLQYLLILPVIFFAIFINARTGLIILGIVLIVFSVFYILNRRHFLGKSGKLSKQNKRMGAVSLLVVGLSVVGIASFTHQGGYFAKRLWTEVGGYVNFALSGGDISATRGTQASTNFSKEFWSTPSDPVQLYLGAGQSVYGRDSIQEFSSDVGYINNVWLFGIAGAVLFHAAMIAMLWQFRPKGKYGVYVMIACTMSLFLFQIKGSAWWSANLGVASIMTLYLICGYETASIGKGAKA